MDDIETLKELVEAEPDDYFTRFCLGKAWLDGGCPQEAIPQLEACIRLNSDYPVAHRYLGAALLDAQQPAAAEQVWKEGMAVAERTGLLQTGKEIGVFLKRLQQKTS